ncbi:MAG TPA: hypothetical protein DIC59_05265 [Candidatus Competibacteraceae bacterium]|nr:hypothetical protein [Candidatus Competibacteraceae bacterium]
MSAVYRLRVLAVATPQRGMALVIVLWIVTLLAVMAGGFAYSMRIETRLAASTTERAQARALAEAGVAYAQAWQLDQDASRKQWPPNGDPHEWAFGGGRLRIEVTSANGLVDLNTADPSILKLLFAGAGVEAAGQDRLVDALMKRRQLKETAGLDATRTQWMGLLQQALFQSVEELQQIEGITKQIYERIADGVTVFSPHLGIAPELTPAWLLRALGLDERAVADYVAARARAAAEGTPPPPPPQAEGNAFFSGGRGNVYHITVAAETAAGTAALIKMITEIRGGANGQNFRVLAWREGR